MVVDKVFGTTDIDGAFHRHDDYASIAAVMLTTALKPVGKFAIQAGSSQG